MINIQKISPIIGIYKVTSPSGKVYIGEAINILRRWYKEYYKLKCKGQIKLYRSFLKYGVKNHKFKILKKCSAKKLNNLELHYQKLYNSIDKGLNIRLGKCGGTLSESTKQKISKALKGRKITWKNNGRPKGLMCSKVTKQKISSTLIEYYKNNYPPIHKKIVNKLKVKEIRKKYSTGKFTRSDLSRKYNVSWGTIKNITDFTNSYKN